jgi:predicted AlkP superfamily pyrophosphatase or phosphodiesterase
MNRPLGVSLLISCMFVPGLQGQDSGTENELPPLVVLCSVDQLATRLLREALPHMGRDGFRRLLREGVGFERCAFAHACTVTGPGHATLSTGAFPSDHGIISNEWWDPVAGLRVYCCAQKDAEPLVPGAGRGFGPENLLAPTLGDAMVGAFGTDVKIASVSWKDRSAILMGGRSADLAIWTHARTGQMITNRVYADEVPDWLAAFNARKLPDSWFGWRWERIGDDSAYAGLVDDRPYESRHGDGKRTLPQVFDGGETEPGPRFYASIGDSPLGNELILETVLAALDGMELGRDLTPDLLCVGFSANDLVGHSFGPGSVEVRDLLLRTDLQLARLLGALDDTVGKGRYVFLLSADHGVSPIPEAAREVGVAAGRASITRAVRGAVEQALIDAFGRPKESRARYATVISNYVYLSRPVLEREGLELDWAARIAAAAAAEVEGVALALTTQQLLADPDTVDPIRRAMLRAIHPERSGDVMIVIERNWIDGFTPASHGTPYDYDREVPFLAMGPGLRPGAISDAEVTPGIGVVLAARLLGIRPPSKAVDTLPDDVWKY